MDIDVFQEAKKVIDALENKEVAPALAWCGDNRSRLKKSKVYAILLALYVCVYVYLFLNFFIIGKLRTQWVLNPRLHPPPST